MFGFANNNVLVLILDDRIANFGNLGNFQLQIEALGHDNFEYFLYIDRMTRAAEQKRCVHCFSEFTRLNIENEVLDRAYNIFKQ